ncbi:MAG: hypothetical protein ACRCUS_08260 [Anaerovoracaceae bacterium]
MSKTILVRRIDSESYERIKAEAKRREIGTETLAREILTNYALSPKLKSVEDKYERLLKDFTGLYKALLNDTNLCIDKNNILYEKILTAVSKAEGEN